MLYGIGTDIVEVARIESILKKHDSRFLDKVFSKTEIQYCKKKYFAAQHYSARFAAKEAFLKCLGMGIGNGISLKDIEIRNDSNGRPVLHVYHKAEEIRDRKNISKTYVSLAHTRKYATALVVLETETKR